MTEAKTKECEGLELFRQGQEALLKRDLWGTYKIMVRLRQLTTCDYVPYYIEKHACNCGYCKGVQKNKIFMESTPEEHE